MQAKKPGWTPDHTLAYIAYTSAIATIAMFFRFGDLVHALGGSSSFLGVVVGLGLALGLVSRLRVTKWSERVGFRPMWLLMLALMGSGAIILALPVIQAFPVASIILGRVLFAAGATGASTLPIQYVQLITPAERRGEAVGGITGGLYVGMMLGVGLADRLPVWLNSTGLQSLELLFLGAAVMSALGAVAVVLIMVRATPLMFATFAPTAVARNPWPRPPLAAVAVAMGYAYAFCQVFLTGYVASTGMGGFLFFFVAYSLSALGVGRGTRDWGKQVGPYRLILLGVALYVFGDLLLLAATRDWNLIFSGIACGASRAVLYPAMIAMAERAETRTVSGASTNLVFFLTDAGAFLAALTMGVLIHASSYQAAIVVAGVALFTAGAVFSQVEKTSALPANFRRRRDDYRTRRKADYKAGSWAGTSIGTNLVFVKLADGLRLDGAFHRPRRSTAKPQSGSHAVVMIHADGDDFCSPSILESVQDFFLDQRLPVLRINTSGRGLINHVDGPNAPTRHGAVYETVGQCLPEVAAWITWLKRQNFDTFTLVGHKLGAIKALYFAVHGANAAEVDKIVLLAPPRLSHSFIKAAVTDGSFMDDVGKARDLLTAGKATELMSVRHPAQDLISAQAYYDKFGPEERYDLMHLVDGLGCPALFLLPAAEEKTSITSQDLTRDLRKKAKRLPGLTVESVAGANQYFSFMRERTVALIETWVRAHAAQSPATAAESAEESGATSTG